LDGIFGSPNDRYSFRKRKTLENGISICDYHQTQGTVICQRNLEEDEVLYDSDDENNFQYHFLKNRQEELLNNKLRPMYPVILPRSLIVCCAGEYCVNRCSKTIFTEKIHEDNQSKFIVCELCRNIVCDKNCISSYNYCLKCTKIHLCGNDKKCVDVHCNDESNHPGWLLKKTSEPTDPTTGIISGYSSYLDDSKACLECDTSICAKCSVKSNNLCAECMVSDNKQACDMLDNEQNVTSKSK